jgi:hypothetical protein
MLCWKGHSFRVDFSNAICYYSFSSYGGLVVANFEDGMFRKKKLRTRSVLCSRTLGLLSPMLRLEVHNQASAIYSIPATCRDFFAIFVRVLTRLQKWAPRCFEKSSILYSYKYGHANRLGTRQLKPLVLRCKTLYNANTVYVYRIRTRCYVPYVFIRMTEMSSITSFSISNHIIWNALLY